MKQFSQLFYYHGLKNLVHNYAAYYFQMQNKDKKVKTRNNKNKKNSEATTSPTEDYLFSFWSLLIVRSDLKTMQRI